MKYIITGGAGHISKPVTENLLKADHEVTVVGRSAANLASLTALGAKAAIGSVEDIAFLKQAFAGADAVYTMVPPNMGAAEWKKWIGQIGKNYADAIRQNGIKYVVNLSSIGAHMPDGAGPVSGLALVEKSLNDLPGVNIKHLRPSYFYDNFLGTVGLVKHMNIIGSNFGGSDFKLVLTAPADIADAATEELLKLDFSGQSIRYIASDEKGTDEIAKAIGVAVGKPELPWIIFSDEESIQGMLQAGLPEEIVKNYVEMGQALQSGEMSADYWKNRPASLGKTKLDDFAKVYAAVYNAG